MTDEDGLLAEAEAKQAELLPQAAAILAKHVADHQRDVGGFHFECKKWGPFLTVHVKRPLSADRYPGWPTTVEFGPLFSVSLNLDRTLSIRLKAGHEPDELGRLEYYRSIVHGETLSVHGVDGRYFYPVFEQRPDDKEDRSGWRHSQSPKPVLAAEGFPRFAKDDEIIFDGIRSTLFAPAGLGQSVLDAILVELANKRSGGVDA